MLFDLLDGRVARLTKTQSAIGVQLDSLADVISFGVAPGIVVYRWSLYELASGQAWGKTLGIFACFVYVACALVRLARFNVLTMADDGAPKAPGRYILGLPTPAAAAILVSIIMANAVTGQFEWSPWIVLVVLMATSFLMVSRIRFRSFKDMKLDVRNILLLTATAAVTAVLSKAFHIAFALAWLLFAYVTFGVIELVVGWIKRTRSPSDPSPNDS